MSEEEWRSVVGWEGLYEVSSRGRVKSLSRNGKNRKDYIRKISPSKSTGYKYVTFSKDGFTERKSVHRVVAEAFHSNLQNHPLVRHLNDVKTDNRQENIAWGTYKENGEDSVRNGRHRMFSVTHCPKGHPYDSKNTRINPLGRRECKTCRVKWLSKSEQLMVTRGLSPGDRRHGTYSGYRHYKCRCDMCKAARREYARDLKKRKREAIN